MTGANAVSLDKFLGGRLRISQPSQGYRAGIDAVLLAASVPARSGQQVLEIGCGVGVASLCLMARVRGLQVTGVEIQPLYAELARENAVRAGFGLEVLTASLTDLPASLRGANFDHVIANPPYFRRAAGTRALDEGRERALGEDTPVADWIDTAIRRLRPGGVLSLIYRVERLPEILAAFGSRLGAVQVLPLSPRAGRPAELFLLRARKGRLTQFQILSPLILHEGPSHQEAGSTYTPSVAAVLRDAVELPGYEN